MRYFANNADYYRLQPEVITMPRTKASARERGYVTAREAAASLRQQAEYVERKTDLVKYNIQFWFERPEVIEQPLPGSERKEGRR